MKICILLPRFNKSPFIYDSQSSEKNYNYMMPLGLPYISAILKQNKFDVTVINLNHEEGLIKDILKQKLTECEYDVLLTGSLSIYYPNIKDYITYIREFSPNTRIIVGGGLISSQPEIMLNLLKPDYIVIGEGERTVIELIKYFENIIPISIIDGVGYLNSKNEVILTKPRKPIMDLDSLPFPDLESFGFQEYLDHSVPENYILLDAFDTSRMYPVLMSRSCPYNCTFCYHQLGQKYRQRSIDNIMSEIKFVTEKYKINLFMCYDELLSHDRGRILEFCEKINEFRKTIPWDIKWNCALRVDNIDDELIKIMKNAGCFMISFGLESYSPLVLKSMKKHTTPEQINNAVKIVSNNNIAIQGTFIFGDPSETLDTANETLKYFKNNQDILRGGVSLGFIMLFQGSPLYKYCLEKGILNELDFIENRAKHGYIFHEPQNLTDKLSHKEFEILKNNVLTTIYTAGYHVTPEFSNTVNGVNEIHIKCPYCNKISILKNVQLPKGQSIQNVGCRYCNGRFSMVSKSYKLILLLMKTIGFYNYIKLQNILSSIKHKLF